MLVVCLRSLTTLLFSSSVCHALTEGIKNAPVSRVCLASIVTKGVLLNRF